MFTTRFVHAAVPVADVDPVAETEAGGVCLTALVDGDSLQQVTVGFRDSVEDSRESGRLIGTCFADPLVEGNTFGNARFAEPCSFERPWLAGHVADPQPFPKNDGACDVYIETLGGPPDRTVTIEGVFSTAGLLAVEQDPASFESTTPYLFVPRVTVERPDGSRVLFEADVSQALPVPADTEQHYRAVCAVKVS